MALHSEKRTKQTLRIPTRPKGGGMVMFDFPGNKPGVNNRKGSKRHCPACGGCVGEKCWNKSGDHAACLRHLEAS